MISYNLYHPADSAQMHEPNKKVIVIAVIIVLLLLCGTGIWWYVNTAKNSAQNSEALSESAANGALPSLEISTLEDAPNVNPAEAANPIKKIKTNPFE